MNKKDGGEEGCQEGKLEWEEAVLVKRNADRSEHHYCYKDGVIRHNLMQ